MLKNRLFGRDIISVDEFSLDDLANIFSVAKKMQRLVYSHGSSNLLRGKIMTALFYEPSSRTFGSFLAAMQRLGGGIIPIQGVNFSSVVKGETLSDTIRVFENYSDVIVLRHPEVGSAKIAAEFSSKPIINSGDGVGEHPTQGLLDMYTIVSRFGNIKSLTVTMVGDMMNGRTVHSLAKLLSLYKHIHINFVSPDSLRFPKEILLLLKDRGVSVHEQETLADMLPHTDVLYVTRMQKERFTDLTKYEKLKNYYIVTPTLLKNFKKSGIVMHPLPRVGEITMDVDLDPRAVYITEQMKNGMFIRMALLAMILTKNIL